MDCDDTCKMKLPTGKASCHRLEIFHDLTLGEIKTTYLLLRKLRSSFSGLFNSKLFLTTWNKGTVQSTIAYICQREAQFVKKERKKTFYKEGTRGSWGTREMTITPASHVHWGARKKTRGRFQYWKNTSCEEWRRHSFWYYSTRLPSTPQTSRHLAIRPRPNNKDAYIPSVEISAVVTRSVFFFGFFFPLSFLPFPRGLAALICVLLTSTYCFHFGDSPCGPLGGASFRIRRQGPDIRKEETLG